jgi:hypothetical protein
MPHAGRTLEVSSGRQFDGQRVFVASAVGFASGYPAIGACF